MLRSIWLAAVTAALVSGAATPTSPAAKKSTASAAAKKPATKHAPVKTGAKAAAAKPAATKPGATKPAGAVATKSRSGKTVKRVVRSTQQAPTSDRYREIQAALIDKGYLQSEATGEWGPDSVEALKRFQADENLTVDGKIGALSLIALGLGPKRLSAQAPPTQPPAQQNPAQQFPPPPPPADAPVSQ